MSLLTPLLQSHRRSELADAPAVEVSTALQVWHVGLSREGMFPHQEASCPCAKAPCGLAIPRPEVFCKLHQGPVEYRQLHVASECAFPRRHWFPRPRRANRHR
jgi:hypothetical protein